MDTSHQKIKWVVATLFLLSAVLPIGAGAAPTTTTTTTYSTSTIDTNEFPRTTVIGLSGIVSEGVIDGQTTDNDTTRHYGGGITIENAITRSLGIQTGLFWVNRVFQRKVDDAEIVQKAPRLRIPVTFRIWPINFLSIGLGPYASFRIQDPENAFESDGADLTASTIATSAGENILLGLDAAVLLNLKMTTYTDLFVEARYSLQFQIEDGEDSGFLQGIAGIRMHLL